MYVDSFNFKDMIRAELNSDDWRAERILDGVMLDSNWNGSNRIRRSKE